MTRKVPPVGDPPFDADPASSSSEIDYFCRTGHMTQLLVAADLALPAAMSVATATAASTLAPLNAVPVVGPFLFMTAMAAILTPYTALQSALTLLLVQDPTANFAQQLANVVNHAVRIPEGKALIPALVSEIAKSVRPTSESPTTR